MVGLLAAAAWSGRVMLGDDTRAALNGAPCAVAIAASGYAASNLRRSPGSGSAYNGSPGEQGGARASRAKWRRRPTRACTRWKWSRSRAMPTRASSRRRSAGTSKSWWRKRTSACGSCRTSRAVRSTASPARSWRRSATRWTSCSWAPAATARPAAGARQHLRLPRAPRPLLAARAAPHRRERRWCERRRAGGRNRELELPLSRRSGSQTGRGHHRVR